MWAAACTSLVVDSVSAVLVGLTSSAMTVAVGTSSCKSPSRFGASSRPNEGYARYIAAWPVKAGDEPKCNRISASEDDDRDCRGGPLCRQRRRRRAWRRNYTHPAANQISCQNRQALVLSLGPPVFDRDVLALDKSRLVQTLTKNTEKACEQGRQFAAEKSNHRHRWLLRRAARGHAVAAAIPAMTSRRLVCRERTCEG